MTKTAIFAATMMLACAPGAVNASSDDAWAAFGKAVSTACVKAAAGQIDKAKAVVDPYGSERFGLALVTGTAKGAKQTISLICVYDKQKKTVELGSELSADQVKVTPGR